MAETFVVPTFYDTRMTASTFDFEAGTGARGRITAALSALDSIVTALGSIDISTAAGGRNALERIRANLEKLSALRGVIGASQSRLLPANSLLESQATEIASAESRIMSADIAEESAAFIRTSILRSTSAALLAQANQQPSLALQLLSF